METSIVATRKWIDTSPSGCGQSSQDIIPDVLAVSMETRPEGRDSGYRYAAFPALHFQKAGPCIAGPLQRKEHLVLVLS